MRFKNLTSISLIIVFCFLHSKELPQGLDSSEIEKSHLIPLMSRETPPPSGNIRNVAEYERMQGVLIRYPFGISADLIKKMSEDVKIYCLVSNTQMISAENALISAGVFLEDILFIVGPTDSYWTRDYGPWWVVNEERKMSIVDFTYNRPRSNDNDAPLKISDYFDTPYYSSSLIHAGGNYMTTGLSMSASSDLVYLENDLSIPQVNQAMEDYYGIDQYHVIADPNNTYIDHIDCWGKYLSPTKVLIRQVPQNHPQYEEVESAALFFLNNTNSYGDDWELFRVYTPDNQPYTNSLILNEKIFVPLVNSEWDNDAILSYQHAMPGYEILGYNGTWESTDALHCRTKGIPDLKMLQIFHKPLVDSVEISDSQIDSGYSLIINIDNLNNSSIVDSSVKLHWRKSIDSNWVQAEFERLIDPSNQIWSSIIPFQNLLNDIQYFIEASDSTGKEERHPIAGYHSFTALGLYSCNSWETGDLNSTGTFDIFDILLLTDSIFHNQYIESCSNSVSDLNNDSSLNLLDIALLIGYVFNG